MSAGEVARIESDDDRLLLAVLERGQEIDVEVVERIVALKERSDDRAAARSIHVAMAAFQAAVPSITKSKHVDYPSRSGTPVRYSYAPLDAIADAIREPLARFGLSYTWDSATHPGGIECVCTVRHIDGATVTGSFDAPVDDAAKMSGPQRTAAALTYARRQSLVQALGLTSTDTDTDAEEQTLAGIPIDVGQLGELTQYVTESGADLRRFLDLLNITTLEELDRARFEEARDLLRRKLARKIADDSE